MSYRVQLVAPGAKGIRRFGFAWAAHRAFASLYDVRAWLGAVRMNLASELAEDEPFFLLAARDDSAGEPVLVLEVARDWPHAITDGIAIRRTTTRSLEATR
jgi:hypothetical protein